MQTTLAPQFAGTPEGSEAEAILRRCVHCGFCTATCPTYQLLGDELDGPRGRIYLIKQVMEGQPATRETQLHLDRCLTCRNCESTCPSGVAYGRLVEIGRGAVDAQVSRPVGERVARGLLKSGLTSSLFGPAIKLGQALRPLVPASLKDKVPPPVPAGSHDWPLVTHRRKLGLLAGCVQPTLAPNINSATARVLDAAGISCVVPQGSGCCGAIRAHLGDHDGGLADMRRNVDAWFPLLERGEIEGLVMNASGCGVTVKEYGRALAHDPAYADKARRVSEATRDLSEWLPELVPVLKEKLKGKLKGSPRKLAYHPPCTLQHGQQLRDGVEAAFKELGFEIGCAPSESHLCCGSAGTYSVLQPTLSKQLRERKLAALAPLAADEIVSANIGCIQHLQAGTSTPVRHWVEVLDEALRP